MALTAIGDARLYRGDAFDVLPSVDWRSVRLMLCDPPYGVELQSHGDTLCRGRPARSARFTSIRRDDSTDTAVRLCRWADSYAVPLAVFGSPFRPLPGPWQSVLVWDKGEGSGAGGDPGTSWKRSWEAIYVRNARVIHGTRDGAVLYHPLNNCKAPMVHHPCEKPVELLAYLIRKLTSPGDLVLDPCAGSGSVGVACLGMGRRYVGVELDDGHYETAVGRLKDAAGVGIGSLFAGGVSA